MLFLSIGGFYSGKQFKKNSTKQYDPMSNWKTFTNSTYKYSISVPQDFSLKLCEECNPPELDYYLRNSTGSVKISIQYQHQWPLTANMSSIPEPVKNIEVVIQGT